MLRAISLFLLPLLLALPSCAVPSDPGGGGGAGPAPREPAMQIAILDFRTPDLASAEAVERYGRTDLLFVQPRYLWDYPPNAGAVARLKARNPRQRLLGYVHAHASPVLWADGTAFEREWYDGTRPFWVWTTAGDTMMTWAGHVMINILDPACRRAMVRTVARWQAAGGNPLDGVLWDYFPLPFWVKPLDSVLGEVDMDGDGVGHSSDPDEQRALPLAQAALVREMQAAMGPRFIQFFNGSRAFVDPGFAALGDGIMGELFPEPRGGLRAAEALDPADPSSLFGVRNWPRRTNGGPWLMLTNRFDFRFTDPDGQQVTYLYADMNRVAALLLDAVVTYHEDRLYRYGWPAVELDLGRGTGPAVRTGDVLTRSFERGGVTVRLGTQWESVPYSFEIVQDGRVVQMLDVPRHLP